MQLCEYFPKCLETFPIRVYVSVIDIVQLTWTQQMLDLMVYHDCSTNQPLPSVPPPEIAGLIKGSITIGFP